MVSFESVELGGPWINRLDARVCLSRFIGFLENKKEASLAEKNQASILYMFIQLESKVLESRDPGCFAYQFLG